MLSLEEIVHALGAGFPPLRARPLFVHRALAVEPDARGPDGATPVFAVPDLHVLSEERARGYGEYFHLNAGREKALVAFLRRLVELRDDPPRGEVPEVQVARGGGARHGSVSSEIASFV